VKCIVFLEVILFGDFFRQVPEFGQKSFAPPKTCLLLHLCVQTGAETSDIGAEAVKPDPGSSWEAHSRGLDSGVGDENEEFCGVVRPLRIPLVIRPVCRTHLNVVR